MEQFLFYPVVVLLGIFLVIFSLKLLFRFIIFCIAICIVWLGLSYLGVLPSPRECLPLKIQRVDEIPPRKNAIAEVLFGGE